MTRDSLRNFDCVDAGGMPIAALAISPSGEVLAASFGETIVLATVNDCQVLQRVDAVQPVNGISFSPDGKRFVAACDDMARVFDASGGETTSELRGEFGGFYTAAWSPDGRAIAAGHFEPFVAAFEAATGEFVQTLDPDVFDDEGRTCVLFSPDGQVLVSTAYNSAFLWPIAMVLPGDHQGKHRKKKLSVRGHTHIVDASYLSDGALLVTLAETETDSALHVWDVSSFQKLRSVSLPHSSTRLASVPGSTFVALAESDGNGVSLWDAATGERANSEFGGSEGLDVTALASDATSGLVVAGTRSGEILGWYTT